MSTDRRFEFQVIASLPYSLVFKRSLYLLCLPVHISIFHEKTNIFVIGGSLRLLRVGRTSTPQLRRIFSWGIHFRSIYECLSTLSIDCMTLMLRNISENSPLCCGFVMSVTHSSRWIECPNTRKSIGNGFPMKKYVGAVVRKSFQLVIATGVDHPENKNRCTQKKHS